MTLTELIARLRELEGKATRGPWNADIIDDVGSDDGDITFCTSQYGRHSEDAKLIAESRNALPLLIKAIEIYREALELIKEECDSVFPNSGHMYLSNLNSCRSFAKDALSDAEELVK